MAQKSNMPNREQNRIKIDMNIWEITDRNWNVTWLRNRVIPVTTLQVPSHICNLSSSVPLQFSLGWSNPPQKLDLQVQDPVSAGKPRLKAVTKVGKGIRKVNKLYPLLQSVQVHKYKLDIGREHYHKDTPWPSLKFHELKQKFKTHSTQMKDILMSIHMVPYCPPKFRWWMTPICKRYQREAHRLKLWLLICQTEYKLNHLCKN